GHGQRLRSPKRSSVALRASALSTLGALPDGPQWCPGPGAQPATDGHRTAGSTQRRPLALDLAAGVFALVGVATWQVRARERRATSRRTHGDRPRHTLASEQQDKTTHAELGEIVLDLQTAQRVGAAALRARTCRDPVRLGSGA